MVAHWFIVDQMSLLGGFFDSVVMLNAILSIAGSSHQGHERFSEISRGRQCSFISFSALLCAHVVSRAALGYCYSWPNFSRRRQDVLEWKYSRYRHVVPDLPAKSSSLDSSIARHWGHSTKSIAHWGNKIAWGKQFFILLQLCFKNVSSVNESSQHYPLKENIDLTVITFSTCILKWKGVFYFQMYLVFSYLKENTHLGMITFVYIVSKNSLSIWRTLIPRFVSVTLLLHD